MNSRLSTHNMEEDLIQFDAPLRFRDIKLPSFWSDKPASWFSLAEARFRTYGVTGEKAKFDQLVGSLSKDSIGRVLDLVENPPLFTPYTILKARLLDAHQLTDYQKVDSLLKMEPLPRCQVPSLAPRRHAGSLPAQSGDEHLLHTPVPLPPPCRAGHHAR